MIITNLNAYTEPHIDAHERLVEIIARSLIGSRGDLLKFCQSCAPDGFVLLSMAQIDQVMTIARRIAQAVDCDDLYPEGYDDLSSECKVDRNRRAGQG